MSEEKNEDELLMLFFRCLTLALCILIICITMSYQYDKYTIKSMVDKGADPIEAACSIKNNGISNVGCIVFLLKYKEE